MAGPDDLGRRMNDVNNDVQRLASRHNHAIELLHLCVAETGDSHPDLARHVQSILTYWADNP